MNGLLRVYLDPATIRDDGYPDAWHHETDGGPPIKDYVRALAGDRCERCGHPYEKGLYGRGEWSPCDDRCTHGGPVRYQGGEVGLGAWEHYDGPDVTVCEYVEARWRILTVHHLNGVKHDCRWWNLAALCQRCHLTIQGRVTMERSYFGEHTEWFKPHAAGFYASHYLSLELDRDETLARLDELLALEHRQLRLTAPAQDGDPQPKETSPCSPPAA